MIIPKEEVEKAAKQFSEKVTNGKHFRDLECGFIAGVEFSEKYVQKHVQDIITENQGLKLYKDNEAERFKKLAVEFEEWLESIVGEFNIYDTDSIPERVYSNEELFEIFIKERNETNS